MKIKSFIIGATALCFGGVMGVILWNAVVGIWLYHAPYDNLKWSAAFQQAVTSVGIFAFNPNRHSPVGAKYFALHTLANGKQIVEEIDPYEWATRQHKAATGAVYAMRDGVVAECGEQFISIIHTEKSAVSINNINLSAPCVIGEEISGGRLLGRTLIQEGK